MLSQRVVEPRGALRHTSGNDLKSRSLETSNRPPRQKRNASAGSDFSSTSFRSSSSVSASNKRSTNIFFDEKLSLQSLYKVLVYVSQTNLQIIYLRDVEKLLESERFYKLFQRLNSWLTVLEPEDDCQEVGEGISPLLPYNLKIRPPEDESDW